MLKTLLLLLIFSPISPLAFANSKDQVISLKTQKLIHNLNQLVGTYYTTFPDGQDTIGTVIIENTTLKFAYITINGNVATLFEVDLNRIKNPEEIEFDFFKHGFEKGRIQNQTLTDAAHVSQRRETISKTIGLYDNSRILEETGLRINLNGELEYYFRRNYYKRKYGFGPWVVDKNSMRQQVDGLKIHIFFAKTSDFPTEISEIKSLAEKMKADLLRRKNAQKTSNVIQLDDYRKTQGTIRCENIF